ncbi:hypothetical protein JCM3770_006403 [Rhodotorula araucariae]
MAPSPSPSPSPPPHLAPLVCPLSAPPASRSASPEPYTVASPLEHHPTPWPAPGIAAPSPAHPDHLRLNLGWTELDRTGNIRPPSDGERTALASPQPSVSLLSDDPDDDPADDLDDGDRAAFAFTDDALDLVDESTETPQQRRERRRRMRRMFGGGRHRHRGLHAAGAGWDAESTAAEDEEGEGEGAVCAGEGRSVGEVAGMVLAGSLSPLPLLLPLACTQLGPGLFVPLLALASVLAWLGAVVVGVEGRYVGARSFSALASGVFPHRFKLHKLGEFLAAVFVLGGSIVRTALDVVAASEVVVDLVVPERRRRDWERGIAVGVICATWLLVPLLVPPLLSLLGLSPSSRTRASDTSEYTRLSSVSTPDLALAPASPAFSPGPDGSSTARRRPRWTALLALPSWSAALVTWPLALVMLGVRMKRLNRAAAETETHTHAHALSRALALPLPALDPADETGASLWPAILLTVAGPMGAAHETFYYLASLARPSSTASAARERRSGFSLSAAASGAAAGEDGPSSLRAVAREGRRNQYPLAVFLGHLGAFLIHLGWALVGSLSLSPRGAPAPGPARVLPAANVLTDARLPRADPVLAAVRLVVLAALVAQLAGHAAVGVGRARRALRPLGGGTAPGTRARAARRAAARVAVWSAVGALAAVVVGVPALAHDRGRGGAGGGHGEGMRRVAEWVGVLIGGVGGCLVPALSYLVLFHLRRPRSILLPTAAAAAARAPRSSSDARPESGPGPDALLARKERQMQRRLSGRRLWTDAAVFGLVAPVGLVLVVRGAVALIRG